MTYSVTKTQRTGNNTRNTKIGTFANTDQVLVAIYKVVFEGVKPTVQEMIKIQDQVAKGKVCAQTKKTRKIIHLTIS